MSNKITFRKDFQPTLKGGNYEITATQEIEGIKEGKPEILSVTQAFQVVSPQIRLSKEDIHSYSPPRNAKSGFNFDIPYIVLNKRTLPWERTGRNQAGTPWLALLVFSEHEVSPTYSMTLDEYLSSGRKPPEGGTPVEAVVPLTSPQIDSYETLKGETCECIEVATDYFNAIAPEHDEMPHLCHFRELETGNKADDDMLHSGSFSVVVANRFPSPGEKNIVHLVSLEGVSVEKLTEATDKQHPIRLISLAQWSFWSKKGKDNFEAVTLNLLERSIKTPDLSIDVDGVDLNDALAARFRQGYVPLPYHMMNGQDTVAWMRGPLIPTGSKHHEQMPDMCWSASSAMRWDQETGFFDQTYAAAWQLGRTLALADQQFTLHLMDLRQKIHHTVDKIFERLLLLLNSGTVGKSAKDFIENVFNYRDSRSNTLLMNGFDEDANAMGTHNSVPGMDVILTEIGGGLDYIGLLHKKINVDTLEAFLNPEMYNESTLKLLETSLAELLGALPSDHKIKLPSKYFSALSPDLVPDLVTGLTTDLTTGPLSGLSTELTLELTPKELSTIFSKLIATLPADIPKSPVSELLVDFETEIQTIHTWFSDLSIDDMPMHHLLPHSQLLPAESLRCFQVDTQWWQAIMDGALSIGAHLSFDKIAIAYLRKQLQKLKKGEDQWGLILDSRLVEAWGGIEFKATKNSEAIEPVITRKLSNTRLLFVFKGKPDKVEIFEPGESRRFGVMNAASENELKYRIQLNGETRNAQKFIDTPLKTSESKGLAVKRVIDVKRLLDELFKGEDPSQKNSAGLAARLIQPPVHFVINFKEAS